MSRESMRGDEGSAPAVAAAAASGLSDLAGSVEAGPVPYERLIAGGRRRLRRRRLLTAAASAVLVVAVAGAVAASGGYGRRAGGSAVAAGPAPSAPVGAAAPGGAARDPFTPVRTMVGQGFADGRRWQAWVALWPATATAEDGARQDRLIVADGRGGAGDPPPGRGGTGTGLTWRPMRDVVALYLVVDGEEQGGRSWQQVPAPGAPAAGPPGVEEGGAAFEDQGAPDSRLPVVIVGVRPDVARVAVTWHGGGSTEAVPVPVGDSPTRWFAIAGTRDVDAGTLRYLGADGGLIGSSDQWFRSR
ncbi:hypothetical protein ABT247_11655 [Kitasatospora sp. NPDC001539]|uniref:hypothetical protein n=1 Tax=Kitasatospora sp. NPDC001539 TaxID=3154384 RepID=UPI003317BFC7